MGGDCSQKLRPRRGMYSSPGHSKPPAHCKLNTLTQGLKFESLPAWGLFSPSGTVVRLAGVVFHTTVPWPVRRRGSATDCLGQF